MALKVFSSNAGHEGGRVVGIDARLADSRIGREKFFLDIPTFLRTAYGSAS